MRSREKQVTGCDIDRAGFDSDGTGCKMKKKWGFWVVF